MQRTNTGNLNSFFKKRLSQLLNIPRKPFKCGQFRAGYPTLAIICDPANGQSNHLEATIDYLADHYNVVIFLPKNCPVFKNIQDKKYWRIYYLHHDDFSRRQTLSLSTVFLTLPDLECVLIDYPVNRHFMNFLWKNQTPTLLFLNHNQLPVGKFFNRILAYSTRVVYDSRETFMTTLSTELWAFPDCYECLVPPQIKDCGKVKNYAEKIFSVIKKAQKQLIQEYEDARFIARSSEFDISYWTGKKKHVFNRFNFARRYVRDYKSGASAARPCAGFHPGIYAAFHDLGEERIDPFVHYLKAGKPHGIWAWTVLGSSRVICRSKPVKQKVALHIHAYYPDMLAGILEKLKVNQVRPDLFLSIKDESDQSVVEQALAGYSNKIEIKVVPNRGRDIGPLFTAFGQELVQNYDIIGHLHTKKSFHIKNRKSVSMWNEFLLTNLLGDGKKLNMADVILEHMQSHEKTALIFPDDKYAVGWASNYQSGLEIAKQLHMTELPKYVVFPTGTMFWAKAEVLKPFIDLDFTWQDYPPEPLPDDGTILHAIERMFALICYQQGLSIATTYLPWTTR